MHMRLAMVSRRRSKMGRGLGAWGALPLDPDLFAELDRRWTAHLGNPDAALGWDEVRSQLGIG